MSSSGLHITLLRPAVLHVLRASGFNASRPLATETFVDITARYLDLLASKTAEYARSNHDSGSPTIIDARMALQDAGAFYPEIDSLEEQHQEDDDMRGFENFARWFEGDSYKEIRRIAGLLNGPSDMVDIEGGAEPEDYLTALKKKHSKTGEESRFQGTALGKSAEDRPLKIEGGLSDNIRSWQKRLQTYDLTKPMADIQMDSPSALSVASSPLSEI